MSAHDLHEELFWSFTEWPVRSSAFKLAKVLAAESTVGNATILGYFGKSRKVMSQDNRKRILKWVQEMLLDEATCCLLTRAHAELNAKRKTRTHKIRAGTTFYAFVSIHGCPFHFFEKFLDKYLAKSNYQFSYLTNTETEKVSIIHEDIEEAQSLVNELIRAGIPLGWDLSSTLVAEEAGEFIFVLDAVSA